MNAPYLQSLSPTDRAAFEQWARDMQSRLVAVPQGGQTLDYNQTYDGVVISSRALPSKWAKITAGPFYSRIGSGSGTGSGSLSTNACDAYYLATETITPYRGCADAMAGGFKWGESNPLREITGRTLTVGSIHRAFKEPGDTPNWTVKLATAGSGSGSGSGCFYVLTDVTCVDGQLVKTWMLVCL